MVFKDLGEAGVKGNDRCGYFDLEKLFVWMMELIE